MKYYDELRSLEQEIIRLDSVESLLRVAGSTEIRGADMSNIIWMLEGMVEDINKKTSEQFYELFDKIRQDTWHNKE